MIEIPLTRGSIAIIDDIDEDLSQLRWYAHVSGDSTKGRTRIYAVRSIPLRSNGPRREMLHRVIASRMVGRELVLKDVVDHIDGNTVNCRRSNLRVCSHSENMRNRSGASSNGTTGILGVSYRTDYPTKPWVAQLKKDGKKVLYKQFTTREEAIAARLEAEQFYFGEFAPHYRDLDRLAGPKLKGAAAMDSLERRFGRNVYWHRIDQGKSIRRLAEDAGMTFSHVSAIEKGDSRATLRFAVALAEALNIGLPVLVYEDATQCDKVD